MNFIGGLDMSHHNNDIDHARAFRQGALFQFHKATQGNYFTDPAFARRMPQIRASGAMPGWYMFAGTSDPRGQVARALDVAGDPRETGDLVQLDWEPDGNAFASPSMAQDILSEWLTQTDGYPIFIYYPHWAWEKQKFPKLGREILSMPLWASHYLNVASGDNLMMVSGQRVPETWWSPYAGWPQVDILQFTDKGLIGGSGGIDLNYFRGDRALLSAFTRGNDMTPDQATKLDTIARQLDSLYQGSLEDPSNVAPRWWRRLVTGDIGEVDYPAQGAGLETIAQQLGSMQDQIRGLQTDVQQLQAAICGKTTQS